MIPMIITLDLRNILQHILRRVIGSALNDISPSDTFPLDFYLLDFMKVVCQLWPLSDILVKILTGIYDTFENYL